MSLFTQGFEEINFQRERVIAMAAKERLNQN